MAFIHRSKIEAYIRELRDIPEDADVRFHFCNKYDKKEQVRILSELNDKDTALIVFANAVTAQVKNAVSTINVIRPYEILLMKDDMLYSPIEHKRAPKTVVIEVPSTIQTEKLSVLKRSDPFIALYNFTEGTIVKQTYTNYTRILRIVE